MCLILLFLPSIQRPLSGRECSSDGGWLCGAIWRHRWDTSALWRSAGLGLRGRWAMETGPGNRVLVVLSIHFWSWICWQCSQTDFVLDSRSNMYFPSHCKITVCVCVFVCLCVCLCVCVFAHALQSSFLHPSQLMLQTKLSKAGCVFSGVVMWSSTCHCALHSFTNICRYVSRASKNFKRELLISWLCVGPSCDFSSMCWVAPPPLALWSSLFSVNAIAYSCINSARIFLTNASYESNWAPFEIDHGIFAILFLLPSAARHTWNCHRCIVQPTSCFSKSSCGLFAFFPILQTPTF
jgi:hypothetical protein